MLKNVDALRCPYLAPPADVAVTLLHRHASHGQVLACTLLQGRLRQEAVDPSRY